MNVWIVGGTDATRERAAKYAEKLGWRHYAVATKGGLVARCTQCQAPDMARYMADFKARRVAR